MKNTCIANDSLHGTQYFTRMQRPLMGKTHVGHIPYWYSRPGMAMPLNKGDSTLLIISLPEGYDIV